MNKGLRDTPRSRVSNDKYRSEHERIFGKKPVKKEEPKDAKS